MGQGPYGKKENIFQVIVGKGSNSKALFFVFMHVLQHVARKAFSGNLLPWKCCSVGCVCNISEILAADATKNIGTALHSYLFYEPMCQTRAMETHWPDLTAWGLTHDGPGQGTGMDTGVDCRDV